MLDDELMTMNFSPNIFFGFRYD